MNKNDIIYLQELARKFWESRSELCAFANSKQRFDTSSGTVFHIPETLREKTESEIVSPGLIRVGGCVNGE